MLRDVLIFHPDLSHEELFAATEELDWELLHIYPSRDTSDGGFIWVMPDGKRAHYIENKRFYVSYLILSDDSKPRKTFDAVASKLPTLDLSDIFHAIEYETDRVKRVEALHRSVALVSSQDRDEAYLEMLRRLLSLHEEDPILTLATLHLCDELGWPSLAEHIAPLTRQDWIGQPMARRVLRACNG